LEYVAIIILLALVQYLWFSVRVGAARPKYGVNAPSTSGNEAWERLYRVQQNTLEQLVVFLPALVLFGLYLSARWALLPGLLYLIGRQLYSHEYIKKPESRGPGMGLTLLASAALLIGAAVGVVMKIA
jgi:glutathione S-transferase